MIKNKKSLLKHFPEGKVLLDLSEEALRFLQPDSLIKSQIKRTKNTLKIQGKVFNLDNYKNIYVIGAGKATYKMAETLNKLLKDKITEGYINVPIAKTKKIGKITVNKSSHPYPDMNGLRGSKEILKIAQKANEKDLVICLISGGGSALMPLPISPLTLNEKITLTKKLLKSKANIHEINTIRKHISGIKGGRLAKAIEPATTITLCISDVLGDRLESIASGPTVEDKTTVADALKILKKYKIYNKKIAKIIRKNETPKNLNKKKLFNFIIGSNRLALEHLKKIAENKSLSVEIFPDKLKGEAKIMSKKFIELAKKSHKDLIIAGGETVVKVVGNGFGGRNQEFALSAMGSLPKGMYLMTLATDGVDGVTPYEVAGAIVSKLDHKIEINSFLEKNNSFSCLEKLNCLLRTGPSGTNVGDISLVLKTNEADK